MKAVRKLVLALGVVAAAALVFAAVASAHARISPPVVQKDAPEEFTLSVPTEKEGATTTKIELTVPSDFAIDSVEPPPRRVDAETSSRRAPARRPSFRASRGREVTSRRGRPRCSASTAQANDSGKITFSVRQTYSDGSVVDWNGPESSDTPAPTIEAVDSLGGGGGTSTLAIVALVLGAAALVVAVVALVGGRGKRSIA